ncbi:MAG: transposase [Candidatus Binataceae bacterium]
MNPGRNAPNGHASGRDFKHHVETRRVVAKAEFYFGELSPRVGFIVTNLAASSRAVVCFYNKRGTAEQWIKEGKQAVAMTRLSCHRLSGERGAAVAEPGRLQPREPLVAVALPALVANWSLTSLARPAWVLGCREFSILRGRDQKRPSARAAPPPAARKLA